MLLLKVYCVVLFLKAGSCMPNLIDGNPVYEPNNNNAQLKRNYPIPLSTQHISNGNPTNLDVQTQKLLQSAPDIYGRTVEPYQNSDAKYRLPNQNGYQIPQSIQRTSDIIYGSESSLQPTYKKDQLPLNQEQQDLRLEVQGVSLDSIKSLLNPSPVQNPLQKHLPMSPSTHFNHGTNKESVITYSGSNINNQKVGYQNPSAEIMYRMNQALPYNVNIPQFTGTPQGNNYNLPNILNGNFKTVANIYSSLQPMKRYTVIHPDGRVEHVDHLEKATARYSDYVLVKSTDIKKYVENNNKPIKESTPQPVIKPSVSIVTSENVNKPITPNLKQIQQQDTFSMIRDDRLPTISSKETTPDTVMIPAIVKPNTSTPIVQQSVPKPTNNIKVDNHMSSYILNNPSATSQSITNETQTENNNPMMFVQNSSNNVYVNKLNEINRNNSIIESSELTNSTETVVSKQTLIDLPIENTSNALENLTTSNLTNISQTTEILSQEYLQNTTYSYANTTENSGSTVLTNAPESNDSTNVTSPNELNIIKSNITSDVLDDRFTSDVNYDHKKNDSQVTDLVPPLPNVERDTENFFFEADEQFWHKLINNDTQNIIYFIFVPPKPKTEKETKTIKYPNGTVFEEVTVTVNEESGPAISKTTTVTHINSTNGT